MRRLVSMCVVVLVASLAPTAPAQRRQGERAALDRLRSADVAERTRGKSEIVVARESLVQALAQLVLSESGAQENGPVGTRPWLSSKHLAIILLGELRAEEGIQALMANLTYRVKPLFGGLMETRSVGAQFPAALSLAQIGGRAGSTILGRLRSTEDPLQRHLCVWALMAMEGADVARFRVEKAIKDCGPYTAWKANLEAALEYFDKPDLDFAPPAEESQKAEGK